MKNVKISIIFIAFTLLLSSCCIFKKGSWAPLPSCKHAEKAKEIDTKSTETPDSEE